MLDSTLLQQYIHIWKFSAMCCAKTCYTLCKLGQELMVVLSLNEMEDL